VIVIDPVTTGVVAVGLAVGVLLGVEDEESVGVGLGDEESVGVGLGDEESVGVGLGDEGAGDADSDACGASAVGVDFVVGWLVVGAGVVTPGVAVGEAWGITTTTWVGGGTR
jgi:hypothetical protein